MTPLIAAERDDLRRQLAEARAEREAMANVLPGVYYMDPPDGGDVSLLKQLQRMSNDAARYRLLRRKFAIISDGEGNAEFCPINLPRPTYMAPNTAIELDTALDRERLGLDVAKRPPTPVGWSDTDWIKHLQEQAEQPHPLAGQHINQGSMDAAADAYEAEYYDALKRDAQRYRWLRGDSCPGHSVRWTQWEVRCWRAPQWTADLRRSALDAAIDAATLPVTEPKREPNPDEVICPACTHQFRAIPENVQAQLWAKREPLSDERIDEIGDPFGYFQYGDAQGDKRRAFVRAIERAHGIGGSDAE